MAYKPHYLMQWGGTLGDQGEIWSNTLRFSSDADLGGNVDPASELPRLADCVNALIAGSSGKFSQAVRATYVKFNAIGADGRYVSGTTSNTYNYTSAARPRGTSTSSFMPYQVSAVISTRTQYERGRGARGRIFSPGTVGPVNEAGRIDPGAAQGLADHYATFISSCNNFQTPLSGLVASVMSTLNGAANEITRVECGDVLDTMRSRRNGLVEARSSSNVS